MVTGAGEAPAPVCDALERRALVFPARRLLVGMSHIQDRALVEGLAQNLQAHREPVAESAGDRDAWNAGHVRRDCEDVRQIHLDWIVGPGADRLTISGGGTSRVFHITSSAAPVTLSGLTISGGSANGGGGILSSAGADSLSSMRPVQAW